MRNTHNKENNRFLNDDGSLKDAKIASAIRKAAEDYENGAILEAQDVLYDIVRAIDLWTENS